MAVTRRTRRLERLNKKKEKEKTLSEKKLNEAPKQEVSKKQTLEYNNFFSRIYETQYKKLVFIPILLLVFAFVVIGMNIAQTGDFMNKGVSLKGGITLTIPSESISIVMVENSLKENYPENDLVIRELSELGIQRGVIIEADINPENRDSFIENVESITGVSQEDYSIEEIGSSLGESFFKQTMFAVLLAFIFMGLVVFWYFRTFIPSAAVILAAFSDIIVTLAIVDVMGMKIQTAGIAAFLMLIGYSVDTDILLSTRVLKRNKGTVMKRVYSAMKTGLIMNLTTIVAVTAGLILADSEVIKQIMTIILIGLLVDIINTWLQNVAILRYYLERKNK